MYTLLCLGLLLLCVATTKLLLKQLPSVPPFRELPSPPDSIQGAETYQPGAQDKSLETTVGIIAQQNLFSPSRSPIVKTETVPVKAKSKMKKKKKIEFVLVSIVKIGDQSVARIKTKTSGQKKSEDSSDDDLYSPGSPIGTTGFVLKELHDNIAILTNNGEELNLKFTETRSEK